MGINVHRRTFADLFVPDIDQGTGTTAMYSLSLVLADDHVCKSRSWLEDEDGVSFACLALSLADIRSYHTV